MLKEIIDTLKDCFTRLKAVNTFRYQSESLNNAQNNFKGFQVYVDDVTDSKLNITDGTFTFECFIMILSPVGKGQTILDVQDTAYTIAATVVEMLDIRTEYQGVLRVRDYSMMTSSHVSDDDAAGVRLDLVLEVPNPALLCDDSIWGEPSVDPVIKPIDVRPIKLPTKPVC